MLIGNNEYLKQCLISKRRCQWWGLHWNIIYKPFLPKISKNTWDSKVCHKQIVSVPMLWFWLKLLSHQIANYNKCVITVIAFEMTIPECAVTQAHLIKPISVSVMFASQLVITQSHKQRASHSTGGVPLIPHLQPCYGFPFTQHRTIRWIISCRFEQ